MLHFTKLTIKFQQKLFIFTFSSGFFHGFPAFVAFFFLEACFVFFCGIMLYLQTRCLLPHWGDDLPKKCQVLFFFFFEKVDCSSSQIRGYFFPLMLYLDTENFDLFVLVVLASEIQEMSSYFPLPVSFGLCKAGGGMYIYAQISIGVIKNMQ